MVERDGPIGPGREKRLMIVHEIRQEMLADEIKENGKDSFMAKNLQRQIDEAEAEPDGDGLDHFHGGMIKNVKPR
jgi:hypothetical protein